MIKALLKKQLLELKNVFFPVKSGKKSFFTTAMGIVVLMTIIIAAVVYFSYKLANILCEPLVAADLSWLYFCLAGISVIVMGTVFGIIAVYSSVFRATDNELLLSLPIKPSLIVFIRIAGNYFIDLLITLIMWLPISIKYFTVVSPTALSVIFIILAILFIPLLCSAIALAIGFIISLITMKFKNNGIVVAVIGIIALVAFYVLYFKMTTMLEGVIVDPESAGVGFKTWGFLFYRLGLAASGDALSALIFFGTVAAFFGLCYLLISINFIKMSTLSARSVKVKVGKNPYKTQSVKSALLKRESARFFSSAMYIMNCGLSSVFLLAISIAAIIFGDSLRDTVQVITTNIPSLTGYIPLIVPAILFMFLFIGGSGIPSVSLEGKSLWVIQSLPVKSKDVLMMKEKFQIMITLVPSVIFSLTISLVLRTEYYSVISAVAFSIAAALFSAAYSLFFGIRRADVNWTNEMTPIKSNVAVLLVMLTGFAATLLMCGLYYVFNAVKGWTFVTDIYISVFTVIMLVLFFVLNKWIGNKGVKKFESL